MRVSQLYLEPILLARRMPREPRVRLLNQTVVEGYEQEEDGVSVFGGPRRRGGGRAGPVPRRLRGGRSAVRRKMGVSLQGDAELGRTRSSLIRAPVSAPCSAPPASVDELGLQPAHPRTVIGIDGRAVWLVHRSLGAG